MAKIAYFENPFDLKKRQTWTVKDTTINQFLDESGISLILLQRPIVLVLNGDQILEEEYTKTLSDDDLLVLMALPEEAATIAAIIEIATIVFYVVATAAIIYTLVNQPDLPDTADAEDGSPTYSIRSRGNRARLGKPKPVVYGTFRVWPDLGAMPFTEFEHERDQVLYQLFEVSQGECVIDVASMRFEDTDLTNFEDYEVEVLQPGDVSTIYPSAVILSTEVSNLELVDTNPVGPYSASNVGEQTTRLAFDIIAGAGLYNQDDKDGSLRWYSVSFDIEANDMDTAESWILLGSETLSGASRDPLRRTFDYVVTAARYEVRVTRLSNKSTSMYISDQVNWSQLKGFIKDSTSITTTTRIGLKIRASEQLGNRALTKFNLICQHKIQTWNSTTGWSVPLVTGNPAWVFADILRAAYGGSRGDQFIDLLGLEALATQFDSEGLAFNGVFDTKGTVWKSLQAVAAVGFASAVDQGGVIRMIRDVYNANPVAMFTSRNIVKDSFKVEHVGIVNETSNAVKVEYYDETEDYRSADVLCALPGSPADTTKTIRYFGVTDRDQAFNLGMYLTAQNHYRREMVTWETGVEGFIPTFGDVCVISNYVLGQEGAEQRSGDIRAFDSVDVVTVTEAVDGLFTSPFIIIRGLDGEPTAPLQCTVIDDFTIRITDSFDTSILVFDVGYERPHFMIGEGVDYNAVVKINKIQPRGDNKVLIEGFVDAPEVYSAADGLPIPPISLLPGQIQIYPIVDNLSAALSGNTTNPIVVLSWDGSNADYFIIQFSDDGGSSWFEVGRSATTGFIHYPSPGTVQYRVAGVNLFRSVWVSLVVDTSAVEFAIPPDITNLALAESFIGPTLKLQWDSTVQDHNVVFSIASVQKFSDVITGKTYELSPREALGRAFDVEVFAVAPNLKIATGSPKLAVSNPAPAILNNIVVAAINNTIAVTFDFPTDTDLLGISVWADTSAGFTPSDVTLIVDKTLDPVISMPIDIGSTRYVKVAAVDVWGEDNLNYSGSYSVTGSEITETEIADDSISTPKLQANSVIASKILVAELSAISADIGTVTAGTMKTTAGTGLRSEISSAGDYPLWIGDSATKDDANGRVYIKSDGSFVINDAAGDPILVSGPLAVSYSNDLVWSGNQITDGNISTFMANAVIGEAYIKDLAVDTLKLADQAVTIPVGVYTSGTSTLSVSDSTKNVQSVTFTSTGAPVHIFASAFLEWAFTRSGSLISCYFAFEIIRDTTVIYTNEYDAGSASSGGGSSSKTGYAASIKDTPGAGSVTYHIRLGIRSSGGTPTTVSHSARNRSLLCMELKK